MSHLPWQPPYMRYQSMGGDDQIEALQTDVMRFMAILGLCLMAIFSLVQSMPYQAAQKPPQLESKALLASEIQELQVNSEKLLDKIKQLEDSLQQKTVTLEQTIKDQQVRLTALTESLQQEHHALAKIRQTLKKEQRNHKQQQAKLDQVSDTTHEIQKKPEKKDFSLRFTSEQTLLHLIQKQKIQLYLVAGKQGWRITNQSTQWFLQKTHLPAQYYQMAAATVPGILKQTAQQQLSVHESSQVIWAVALPSVMATSIKNLMQQKTGGELVIEQTGVVKLNP